MSSCAVSPRQLGQGAPREGRRRPRQPGTGPRLPPRCSGRQGSEAPIPQEPAKPRPGLARRRLTGQLPITPSVGGGHTGLDLLLLQKLLGAQLLEAGGDTAQEASGLCAHFHSCPGWWGGRPHLPRPEGGWPGPPAQSLTEVSVTLSKGPPPRAAGGGGAPSPPELSALGLSSAAAGTSPRSPSSRPAGPGQGPGGPRARPQGSDPPGHCPQLLEPQGLKKTGHPGQCGKAPGRAPHPVPASGATGRAQVLQPDLAQTPRAP